MNMRLIDILIWFVLPMANFFGWFYVGRSSVVKKCDDLNEMLTAAAVKLHEEKACEPTPPGQCELNVRDAQHSLYAEFVNTVEFDKYRTERLATMTGKIYMTDEYPEGVETSVLRVNKDVECKSTDHIFMAATDDKCVAVVYVGHTNYSYNIIRTNTDVDFHGITISNPDPSQIDKYSASEQGIKLNEFNEGKAHPAGYFRKVPKDRGRIRLKEKLYPMLKSWKPIQDLLDEKLERMGVKEGDDVVVMAVNEGEIDLFLNFACSCKLHDISLQNVLVFVGGGDEIVSVFEATGASAIYHEGFASVSRMPSVDYLDRVFVDMMWYKSFSVYLLLRRGINILFQDVDLVWFRDPLPYFHDVIESTRARSEQTGSFIEAFFSDDGQRSMRYTPFFANSGFYYFLATDHSKQFTWSIMAAMDSIQVLGSHQNVFTQKLIDGQGLSARHTKMLSLNDFPNGIMYHHDRKYMKQLKEREVDPYGFHMCWTQGKQDKLKYLRKANMWYLQDLCSPHENLIPSGENPYTGERHPTGKVYKMISDYSRRTQSEQWKKLSHQCCLRMPGSP